MSALKYDSLHKTPQGIRLPKQQPFCREHRQRTMKKQRYIISELNIARGIGIYLVVLGHALDHYNRNYIPLGPWMNVWAIIYMFHMPLFFFVAGYVYNLSSVSPSSYRDYPSFLTNKARHLLLPYFSFSLILLALRCSLAALEGRLTMGSISSDLFLILINPHKGPSSYLWFIYTLFVMYGFFPFVDITCRKNSFFKPAWLALFLCLYWLSFILGYTMLVDLCANYIFFFLGYLIYQHFDIKSQSLQKYSWCVVLIFISFSLIYILNIAGQVFRIPYRLAFALIGIMLVINISSWITNMEKGKIYYILNRLGKSSYDIYLLHYIVGIYSFGIIFYKIFNFTINPRVEVFIILFILPIVSIAFSLVLSDMFLNKYTLTRKLFLGR